MRQTTKSMRSLLLSSLAITSLLPRCNCDEGQNIQRAAVEMRLTFLEEDSCSGAAVPRRIPDDFDATNRAAGTDFGSRGERTFEIRSVGSAPLSVNSIGLSDEDPEFTVELFSALGGVTGDVAATAPLTISPNADLTAPAALFIRVSYAAADAEPDLVDLVIVTDDPDRKEVRFALSAGRGRIMACGNTGGCDATAAVEFGDVSLGETAMEMVTIKNVGMGDLDLRSIRLESLSAEFCSSDVTEVPAGSNCQLVPQCLALKPGEEYTINLTYAPVDGGLDTGVIEIVSGDAMAGTVEVPINARGAGPAICACVFDGTNCSPVQMVDFGLADVGGAGVPKTVRLESCGTEAVDLGEAALETDPNNAYFTGPDFQITTAFSTGLLEPGTYSEGVITYNPASAGTHRGGLRFTIATSGLKSWLLLTGQASTCDLQPLPTSVNFGQVAGGSTGDRNVILANVGTKDCTVTAITDPADPNFVILNKPALPSVIAAGADVTLQVRFSAPAGPVVSYMSSFDVTSDEPGPGANNTIELVSQGGGTPVCEVTVTPSGNDNPLTMRDGRLEFGAVNIGYRKTLSVRIDNVGNTDCMLSSWALVTQAPTQFTVTSGPTPFTFTPGQSAQMDVLFAPTSAATNPLGLYGGLLNHLDFTLAGTGLVKPDWSLSISARPTVPTIDVIPQDVDFGVVTWENPQPPDNRSSCGSVPRSVNIYNSGTGALTVTSLNIDSTSDPVFLISEVRANGTTIINPPYSNITVQAGEHVQVDLRFFPSRANPAQHQGLLVIDNDVTNAGGNGAPLTVPLVGQSTTNSNQTDVFQQLVDNKIDILWVVDDSGSMSEEQALLGSNFGSFIQFADTLGVDYQIGVTTTEINDAPAGKIWACNGFNKIIRNSDANRAQAFDCAASVTSPPNGNSRPNPLGSDEAEAGLQAARLALDVPIINAENAGFLRPDARLAVIMVSDEEDQSPGSVNLYIDFFRNIKGFANPQLVSVSAIAGDVPGGCATAAEGRRYSDAVSQLNGQFESICTQSWSQLLMNIGLDVFTLRTAWTLTRPADPSSITVRVDGTSIPQNGSNGWTYDPASNTVTFHGTQIPDPGSTIEVQYGSQCLP